MSMAGCITCVVVMAVVWLSLLYMLVRQKDDEPTGKERAKTQENPIEKER